MTKQVMSLDRTPTNIRDAIADGMKNALGLRFDEATEMVRLHVRDYLAQKFTVMGKNDTITREELLSFFVEITETKPQLKAISWPLKGE